MNYTKSPYIHLALFYLFFQLKRHSKAKLLNCVFATIILIHILTRQAIGLIDP